MVGGVVGSRAGRGSWVGEAVRWEGQYCGSGCRIGVRLICSKFSYYSIPQCSLLFL